MISVLVYLDDGDQTHWRYALDNFEADRVYVAGGVQTPRLRNYTEGTPSQDLPVILLSPEGSEWEVPTHDLRTFNHPEDALYVFYPNFCPPSTKVVPDQVVFIPTDNHPHGMYNYTAYSITMWHRRSQQYSHGTGNTNNGYTEEQRRTDGNE